VKIIEKIDLFGAPGVIRTPGTRFRKRRSYGKLLIFIGHTWREMALSGMFGIKTATKPLPGPYQSGWLGRNVLQWLIMNICIALVCMMFVGTAAVAAEDSGDWTTEDTAVQVAYSALHIMDWSQTLHMARNPGIYEERNPIVRGLIGKHPSEGRVNALVGASLALQWAIAYSLDKPYRGYWQAFWIGVEATAVGNNINAGVRISF